MGSLREREDELFGGWKVKRPNRFAKDGAGCEYENSKIKILFILKETNNTDCNWDGRLRLDGGMMCKNGTPIKHTWNNIFCWASYLMDNKPLIDCKSPDKAEERAKIFKKIAAMNLKKESGGSQSKYDEIRSVAIEDSALIKEQIEMYMPDIIICCGKELIFNRIKSIFAGNVEQMVCKNARIIKITLNGKTTTVLDFYHPQARKKKPELFKLLEEAKECLK